MRFVLVLLGLLLMAFGLVMCFGTIVGWTEKTSEYSVTTDIAGFIFMGIAPFALGVGLLAIGILLQLRRRRVEERNDNTAYSPKN